ncbi:MAG TPA: HD domain-containing protein [Candidatus Acidoferrales bacterium]|jgi:putative hydrolase of HD superfamily|nr:HD domain-containing protein [Candidatus Acidoferrales bacterium]
MADTRLDQFVAFLIEADKLKKILRRTLLADASRRENSAEHSWHLALSAMALEEYAAEPVDLRRVLEMVVVHDLVEIDAGDTFAYDVAGNATRHARESAAADRLFGLLPPDAGARLRALWEEFEARATPEARFATAVDRIQPFLQNVKAGGGTWKIYGLRREQVLERMDPVRTALPALWPMVTRVVDDFFAAPAQSS